MLADFNGWIVQRQKSKTGLASKWNDLIYIFLLHFCTTTLPLLRDSIVNGVGLLSQGINSQRQLNIIYEIEILLPCHTGCSVSLGGIEHLKPPSYSVSKKSNRFDMSHSTSKSDIPSKSNAVGCPHLMQCNKTRAGKDTGGWRREKSFHLLTCKWKLCSMIML